MPQAAFSLWGKAGGLSLPCLFLTEQKESAAERSHPLGAQRPPPSASPAQVLGRPWQNHPSALRGRLQKQAAASRPTKDARHSCPLFPLLPPSPAVPLGKGGELGASGPKEPLKKSLLAQFSSSVQSHPSLWVRSKPVRKSSPPCSPSQIPSCLHIPYLICPHRSLVMLAVFFRLLFFTVFADEESEN